MYRHRIFDLSVAAEFEIPELPAMRHGWPSAGEIRVSLAPELSRPQQWFLRWPAASPSPEFRIGHVPGGYLLEYTGLTAYFVSRDGAEVHCEYHGQQHMRELRRLLIDQAIPRARSLQGALILHAAGIGLRDYAICLMGPSGFGKSTLSGAFAEREGWLLSDDALCVGVDGTNVDCIGAYSGLRLWPDSAANADIADFRRLRVSERTTKVRLLPKDPTDDPPRLPLRAVLLLDHLGVGVRDGVVFAPVPPRDSMVYLTSQSFKLDTSDRRQLRSLLGRIARVVETVPVVRVSYERRYDLLPIVVERIIEYLRSAASQPSKNVGD